MAVLLFGAPILPILIVFLVFTFPANRQTANWTVLPENWQELRRRWEYSHAVGAGLRSHVDRSGWPPVLCPSDHSPSSRRAICLGSASIPASFIRQSSIARA